MIFLLVMEFLFIAISIIILVTQVIIPVMKGRSIFPIFRKQGKLEEAEVRLNQKQFEDELQFKLYKREKESENGSK